MTMPDLVNSIRTTSGSVKLLTIWVDSSGTATLSAQPVLIAVQPVRVVPNGSTTWRTATWVGAAGTARAARILIGPSTPNVIPVGEYDVWSKVTDNPEIPETFHGRLTIY